MPRYSLLCWLAAVILFSLVSCSENPVQPELQVASNPGVEIIDANPNHQCLGYYGLAVDTSDWKVTVLPQRAPSLHVNVTGIMNTTMGVTAKTVPAESDPANGLIVMDIGLKHPFSTKPQLTGFDVKGILMTSGSLTAGGLKFAGPAETRLANADGYSRWWNPSEFMDAGMFGYVKGNLTKTPTGILTANVNPYKRFADILDKETDQSILVTEPFDSDMGRGVFRAGKTNTRRYRIQFEMNPGPKVLFGYAVDACWAPPTPNPPTAIPDNFPIAANQPEPYMAEVEILENTLYFNPLGNNGGGDLRVNIAVHDWQGQSAGDIIPQVSEVKLYVPGFLTDPVTASLSDWNATEAVYQVFLQDNIHPESLASVQMIFEIVAADSGTYKQTAQSAPNVPLQLFQVFDASVSEYNCPADDNESFAEALQIALDGSVDGTLCKPDDQKDYYSFSIPTGFDVSGTIKLISDSESVRVTLYDSTPTSLATEFVSGGEAVINVGLLGLFEGNYNVAADSIAFGNVGYSLEMDITLTPKAVDILEGEYTPDFLYCNPENVLISGDYAIMLSATGLWVYDVSNVQNPVGISHEPFIPAKYINSVALDGTNLYYVTSVGAISTVHYIDFTNFSSPVFYDSIITLPQASNSLEAENNTLFIGHQDGIDVYSTSPTPSAPVYQTTFAVSGYPRNMEMLLPGQTNTHLVFSVANSIYSYNVDNPADIFAEGNCSLPDDISYFSINYDDIYAAVNGTSSTCHVYSIQQSTGSLAINDDLDLSSYIGGISAFRATEGQYVIATSFDWDNPEVVFINKNDPTNIMYDGKAPIEEATSEIADISSGDYSIFTHDQSGWSIFDTSSTSFESQYQYNGINTPIDSVIPAEDVVLVLNQPTNNYQQLYSVDLSSPANIAIADMIQFDNNWIYRIAYNDHIAATSDAFDNIMLIDFSDPYNLDVVNNITPAHDVQSQPLFINNTTLYAILYNSGYVLQAWDITNPSTHLRAGTLRPEPMSSIMRRTETTFTHTITAPTNY
jgi:hypothetical protein